VVDGRDIEASQVQTAVGAAGRRGRRMLLLVLVLPLLRSGLGCCRRCCR
jgi:hypothetical protein